MIVAIIISGAMLLLAHAVRSRLYRRWCRLPPVRNDAMTFLAVPSTRALPLDAFVAPPIGEGAALLDMRIRSTLSGRVVDPWLEFDDGTRRWRQYFERGAHGTRVVDATPVLRSAGGRRLTIRRRGLRADGFALSVFRSPEPVSRVLVLAPHPDDAEIAAFALYSSRTAWVVTLTAGYASGRLPPAMVERRVAESLSVPAAAGVPREQCVNLAFPDGTLDALSREPHVPRQLACERLLPRAHLRRLNARATFCAAGPDCRWVELVDSLRSLVDLAQPDAIVAPHPLLDAHPDHVATTRAIAQSLEGHPSPPDLLLYVVHARDCAAHPLGPAGALASLPHLRPGIPAGEAPYSLPLSVEMQTAKLQGLGRVSMIREAAESSMTRLASLLAGVPAPQSHLRRAVRAQEFFYRIPASRLPALLRGDLQT